MNKVSQSDAPFKWQPHVLLDVDTTTKERTGMVGRAIAIAQNGMEFVILAKTADDLDLITQNFMGFAIDKDRVYRATMISSEGIQVQVQPELPQVGEAETPVEHVTETPTTPVEHVTPAEDDDEL